ncbi:MAG: hypothetical protein PHW82_17125 [Bacteroidales bacterium]|nr:hypothetical protein [Bacteroidales bacterium]
MICIHESPSKYVAKYGQILAANAIPYEMVNCQDEDFWQNMQNASQYIYYLGMGSPELLRHHNLISVLDKVLKIPCFPNWETSWHYDDKIAETFLLQSKGYPLAQSWVFWDKSEAHKWAAQACYPLVFKLKNGASSINVVKVSDYKHASKLINLMFGKGIVNNRVPGSDQYSIFKKDLKTYIKAQSQYCLAKYGFIYRTRYNLNREQGYVLFQEFIPNNNYDTRVTIIGDAAFAFIRKNRPNDFRSSGSGNIDYALKKINLETLKIARQISQLMKFQAMTYDFLLKEDGSPVITEVGCQFNDLAIYRCPGYWDSEMNWHEGHFWPQYIQLRDLLKLDDLIQPEISF